MKKSNLIEIKAQTETLYTFKILNNNTEGLLDEITQLVAGSKKQLQDAPVILEIKDKNFQANELAVLVEILTQKNLVVVGVRTDIQELIDFAKFSGLAVFDRVLTADKVQQPRQKVHQADPHQEKIYKAPKIVANKVRASAQILVKDNDLVLLDIVKAGAEVIADGSISAYKEVKGKVFAGASGDEKALIFIHSFNPQLVSIAGVYKKFDIPPVQLYARPVIISLINGKLNFQVV